MWSASSSATQTVISTGADIVSAVERPLYFARSDPHIVLSTEADRSKEILQLTVMNSAAPPIACN